MADLDLGEVDGLPVAATTIAIRNTGDGLSNAMKVAPEIMHHGQMVYVVIECKVVDVQNPFHDDTEKTVDRKHILKAGNAVTVPGSLVRSALNEMAAKIQHARDEESKAMALDLDFDPLNPDQGKGDDKADAKKTTKPTAKKAPAKRTPRKQTGKGPALKSV